MELERAYFDKAGISKPIMKALKPLKSDDVLFVSCYRWKMADARQEHLITMASTPFIESIKKAYSEAVDIIAGKSSLLDSEANSNFVFYEDEILPKAMLDGVFENIESRMSMKPAWTVVKMHKQTEGLEYVAAIPLIFEDDIAGIVLIGFFSRAADKETFEEIKKSVESYETQMEHIGYIVGSTERQIEHVENMAKLSIIAPPIMGDPDWNTRNLLNEICKRFSEIGLKEVKFAMINGIFRQELEESGDLSRFISEPEFEKAADGAIRNYDKSISEIPGIEMKIEGESEGKYILLPLLFRWRKKPCEHVSCVYLEGKGVSQSEDQPKCSEFFGRKGDCCYKTSSSEVEIETCRNCPVYPFSLVIALKTDRKVDSYLEQLLIYTASRMAVILDIIGINMITKTQYDNLLLYQKIFAEMSHDLKLKFRLEKLLHSVLSIFGTLRGSILLLDAKKRDELQFIVWKGLPKHVDTEKKIPVGEGISGNVIKFGKSMLLQNGLPEGDMEGIDETITSAMSVSLNSRDRAFGVLNIASADPGVKFCISDLNMLETLCSQATMGIENAFLYEYMEEKEKSHMELFSKVIRAQEDERKKIASDIHDDTIQSLVSSFYILESIGLLIESSELDKANEELASLKDVFHINIKSLRRLLFDLMPSLLEDAGLIPALDNYMRKYGDDTGIRTSLYADETITRFEALREISLYRLAQEALVNVRKHSDASNVEVRVSKLNNDIVLTIRDNGKGFNPEDVYVDSKRNFGLRYMKERALMVGGDVRIVSSRGNGTEITIFMPV